MTQLQIGPPLDNPKCLEYLSRQLQLSSVKRSSHAETSYHNSNGR